MRRRIYVTQSNIDNGVRDSATNCMVAMALRDANFINPSVLIGLNYSQNGISINGQCPVDFPDSLGYKIVDFECNRNVNPFYFDVWMIDGEIVQIGEAVDMDNFTHDCDDLIGEIETFLAGDEVLA